MRFDFKKFSQLWYLLDNLKIFDLRQYSYYFKNQNKFVFYVNNYINLDELNQLYDSN